VIADADTNATDVMETVYSKLLQLAVEFITEMDVGYTDCMVRVASCCRLRYDVLKRRHDFVVIATIPNSVDVSGVGLCDDFIFAKCLQLSDRPVTMTRVSLIVCRVFHFGTVVSGPDWPFRGPYQPKAGALFSYAYPGFSLSGCTFLLPRS